MGLNFGNSSARWSYSGFSSFRNKLADSIGINLSHMRGFGGKEHWEIVFDDIVPLLNHSDCEGELSPEDCKRVAPRLREIVSSWPDLDYDKTQALMLAQSMENCASTNNPLEFR
jgi:hypothetical protein